MKTSASKNTESSLIAARYYVAQFQRDNGYAKQAELEPIINGGGDHTLKSVLTIVLATLLLAEDLHCEANTHADRYKSFTSEDTELYIKHQTGNGQDNVRDFLEDLHETLDWLIDSNRKCQGINVLIAVLNKRLGRIE